MGFTGKVISGDCRVDIPWLPADLVTSSAPARLRDRMPHVEGTEIGEQWFAGGEQLGFGGGSGVGAKPKLFRDPYVPGLSTRLGRMEEMNFFTDAKQGKFHPTTPELRIKDQEPTASRARRSTVSWAWPAVLGPSRTVKKGRYRAVMSPAARATALQTPTPSLRFSVSITGTSPIFAGPTRTDWRRRAAYLPGTLKRPPARSAELQKWDLRGPSLTRPPRRSPYS